MTSCVSCGGQLAKSEGETVCLSCGQSQGFESPPPYIRRSSVNALQATHLGSYVGNLNEQGTTTVLNGESRQVSQVKLRADTIGNDYLLATLEQTVHRISEKLGLSHLSTTEAVLIVRQTYARSRKMGLKPSALSAHAILVALRRAGRTDISTKQVIEAHRNLGRRLKLRHLIQVEMEFPLPEPQKEDFLTMGVRRLFAGSNDTRLIGSVLTEAKAVLTSFGESAKNPRTLAGVALYVAGQKVGAKLTQRKIASVVGVSEYTVRGAVIGFGFGRGH